METTIKKFGNSNVIVLSPEFMKIHDLETGDIVDISDITKKKKRGKDEKGRQKI